MKAQSKFNLSIVIFVLWATITMGVAMMQAQGTQSLAEMVSSGVAPGLVLAPVFLIAVMAWLRWDGLGLSAPVSGRSLLILWLPLLYILGILFATTANGWPSTQIIGFVAINCILVGVSEELMFRGILLRGALERMTITKALILSSILFGLVHVSNVFITGLLLDSVIQATAAFMSGIFYVAVRIRTRSLYPMIIVHALWDFSLFVMAKSVTSPVTAEIGTTGKVLGPLAMALPLFLYGLFLLRHVGRDYADMSEVRSAQTAQ